jgi:replicative DNA helicase
MNQFRTTPFNDKLEESILFGCISNRDVAEMILPNVTASHFFSGSAQHLYKAVSNAYKSGSCDPTTVSIELEKAGQLKNYGGESGLISLIWQGTTYATAESHLAELQQYKVKRSIIEMANLMIADAFKDEISGFDLADRIAETSVKLTETTGLIQTATVDEHIRR